MEQNWDYIIVGAGSAGGVLAEKLSADPSRRVLLLEAGPDYRGDEIPEFLRGRTLETGLVSTPTPEMLPEYYWVDITARRRPERPVEPYLRGRGAGGSSSVNGLVWVRPEADDYRNWARLGATGWDWEQMLPHLRAIENDIAYGAEEHHGGAGPIPVHREERGGWGDIDLALEAAALDAGYSWDDDYNRPGSTGISRYPSNNTADGRRVSSNHGYLDPARDRANLTIRGGAQVARVIVDDGTAVGVELLDGTIERVRAGGEVILSAGAAQSPAILMRSGIGPAADLEALGIPVVSDLPVGRHAQDHAIVFVELQPKPGRSLPEDLRPTNVSVRYSSGLEGTTPNDVVILATNHNYWFGNDRAGLAVQLNQALSHGTLQLQSADPAVSPHIELQLLSDPVDEQRLADGVARALALMDHPRFRDVRVGEPLAPRTREELLAQVKDVMHLCATAPMGRPGDGRAVLDPECRVLGVSGLRVVDASSFPSVVSANINLAVFALASRAAELILDGSSDAEAPVAGVLIDGRVHACADWAEVRSPATGRVVGRAPMAGRDELDLAVAAARRAQPQWAADETHRRDVLRAAADVIEAHADELARLVSDETGKPLPLAMFEPLGAAEHMRWIADQDLPSTRLSGEADSATGVTLEYVPFGVVGAIIPWNVPLIMMLHKFAQAARMGNTVVAKPSPFTPLSSLRAAELLAGVIPAGVLNVVSGGDEIGRAVVEHPGIDMISFTGSSETGSKIMASAAPTLKRVSLELGGNDAAIVLPDVDLDSAAERIFGGAFILSGQACAAIKRLYVHDAVYDELLDRLARLARTLQPGDPFDAATTFGPLMTGEQFTRVVELVDDARSRGGRIVTGGGPVGDQGYFFAPTIVDDLPEDARLVAEEQFGPVLPVMRYVDLDDAIARANDTAYGLSASVWSSDPAAAAEVARKLEAGTVWVNKHAVISPEVPFGGAKRSGFGREGGLAGILNFGALRTVDVDAP